MDDVQAHHHFQYRLKSVFIATVVLALVVALVAPPLRRAREINNCSRCHANLSMIGLALRNYHDHYGCLPPSVTKGVDGRPWHSWRVLILPFLEDRILYSQYRFDEPWDGPGNIVLADMCPKVYRCPSCKTGDASRDTSYVILNAARSIYTKAGALLSTDASSLHSTLICAEVVDSEICWIEPRDCTLDMTATAVSNSERANIESTHDRGASVLFLDGHYDTLLPCTTLDDLRILLDPAAPLDEKESAYRRSTVGPGRSG